MAEPAPLYVPDPLTVADRARVRQRFARLRGPGGVTFGFETGGPLFEAATPKQLVEQVETWAVNETRGQRPS
jgi:hypothetical protein